MVRPRTLRRGRSVATAFAAITAAVLVASVLSASAATAANKSILASGSPSLTKPVYLDGATVSGTVFLFHARNAQIKSVSYSLGKQPVVSQQSPFLMSTKGLDTTTLANGVHAITAQATTTTGQTSKSTAQFTVKNAAKAATAQPRAATQQRPAATSGASKGTVQLTKDGRYFQYSDGTPFFWLADTGWEMFHRLDQQQAQFYLDTRAQQGFTVIQSTALAVNAGINEKSANGYLPLVGNDPANPDVKDGAGNDYWDDMEAMVQYANQKGMQVAIWPAWGSYVTDMPIFDNENARSYGEFLGQRFGKYDVFWVTGGDRAANQNGNTPAVWEAMAAGIRATDAGKHLISHHPLGEASSTEMWKNQGSDLDFNMVQSGHKSIRLEQVSGMIDADYEATPAMPVLDGEPRYENHPKDWKPENGWWNADEVRQVAWYQVFAGAAGHTYGNHTVWQMYKEGVPTIFDTRGDWTEEINSDGATQMIHLRNFMMSVSYLDRIPDQSLITDGAGRGTRSVSGKWGAVYLPEGGSVGVDTSNLAQGLKASWYNPRTGESQAAQAGGTSFTAPGDGDWVLLFS